MALELSAFRYLVKESLSIVCRFFKKEEAVSPLVSTLLGTVNGC